MNNELILACDLGGTNLRMAAVNVKGEILHLVKLGTPKAKHPAEIARSIIEAAEQCRAAVRGFGTVRALAAAVPATINAADGIILKSPNVPALDGFRFSSIISNELSLPVILENDANAAAIGEHAFGAAKNFQNAVIVTLGTGVGGGIIINGNILRGINGTAGEIGHICVEQFGAPCGCGSVGCLEQYASATAIVRLVRELADEYPNSVLRAAETQMTSFAVYQAGIAGDELALEVFRRMGFYLGAALADLVNVLNPEVIVIGGGASAAWDLFIKHMREQIRRHAFREPGETVKVVRASLGDDRAGILGASKLAFDQMF
jgi:glucokinase